MPYIKPEYREQLDNEILLQGNEFLPDCDGELNYVITAAVNEHIRWRGLSYSSINECIGVLECAKLELYRRIAAPYEDTKIEENGDVYTV